MQFPVSLILFNETKQSQPTVTMLVLLRLGYWPFQVPTVVSLKQTGSAFVVSYISDRVEILGASIR